MVERSVGPSATVVRNDEVLAAVVDGELVLMSVEQGLYFGLDPIGADIWRRMETAVRVSDLCACLVADYDGDPMQIERDVLDLLGRMADRKLVSVTE
ncbi:PqqD family protein [Azospirillum thermophilum]|uniref:PqqD family protein n=1 Tax=Azospirillum thermophilum TaxID=2202148 RepID=A0A2S2CVK0_9PROT|nr:PqqD family protein [Azospirillum thermophilum]AWK88543.1 PqqD family protein [Azospirillum thermophilum]